MFLFFHKCQQPPKKKIPHVFEPTRPLSKFCEFKIVLCNVLPWSIIWNPALVEKWCQNIRAERHWKKRWRAVSKGCIWQTSHLVSQWNLLLIIDSWVSNLSWMQRNEKTLTVGGIFKRQMNWNWHWVRPAAILTPRDIIAHDLLTPNCLCQRLNGYTIHCVAFQMEYSLHHYRVNQGPKRLSIVLVFLGFWHIRPLKPQKSIKHLALNSQRGIKYLAFSQKKKKSTLLNTGEPHLVLFCFFFV